eukprot:4379776-Amphidinium_carterae.1
MQLSLGGVASCLQRFKRLPNSATSLSPPMSIRKLSCTTWHDYARPSAGAQCCITACPAGTRHGSAHQLDKLYRCLSQALSEAAKERSESVQRLDLLFTTLAQYKEVFGILYASCQGDNEVTADSTSHIRFPSLYSLCDVAQAWPHWATCQVDPLFKCMQSLPFTLYCFLLQKPPPNSPNSLCATLR